VNRALAVLLAAASLVLPRPRRARWREEAMAVLLATSGARRLGFTLDTVVKVPVLAWHYHRTDPLPPVGRWPAALAGAGLLSTPVLIVAALSLAPVIGEDAAEFLFLMAPGGMLPLVAVRSFRVAAHRGGTVARYVVALLVTVFAGTGPVAAGALSVLVGVPGIALVGSVVPGGWLICVGASALARRHGPPSLAVVGMVAGAALVGVLLGLQLTMLAAGSAGLLSALTALSLFALVPAYLVWSLWSGTRLLRGSGDLPA
jgi:hypothetical protein